MLTRLLLLAPHEQPGFGTTRSERIERRLMHSFIEKLRQRLFLRAANAYGFAIHNLSDVRCLIVQVADQNRLRRTDDDARGFQSDIDAMRAEVTLLRRMIFGIDKDRVVRTGCHAGLAADADRFVEVDDAVGTLEHRGRRTGSDARRVRTLITARHLMCATNLWKHADINVLDVRARDADRNHVFRLARSRAGMTTDATGMVYDLGPLHAISSS